MNNKVIISKDEWADNLGEYMKKFRHENPYYPIDPFQRICEKRLEFITDDNKRHQRQLSKEAIANFGEPPF
jgi:hypothetical protein